MSLIDSASLIVTPNAYKEGTLYSVIPSDGSGDLSVTRATTATRVNSAGLVELVPYNLAAQSNGFSDSVWVKSNTTVTSGQADPFGGNTAFRALNTAAGGFLLQSGITITGASMTASVWVKSNTGSTQTMFFLANSGAEQTSVSVTTSWQRVTFSFTSSSNTNIIFANNASAALDILIYGFQLVEGSVAKDYQKTETRLNIPRLDYSNGTCPSILVEPQRTNSCLWSEDFANASWTKAFGSLTSNAIISPSGTLTADKWVENTTNIGHYLEQSFTSIASTTYTFSLYAKAAERTRIVIQLLSITAPYENVYVEADLIAGTLVVEQGYNGATFAGATIEELPNGWYRITASGSIGAKTNMRMRIYIANDLGQITYLGDGTSGLYVWGAQLELGNYSTSYIPTTSASVTRNGDAVFKGSISSLIGATEGVLFLDFIKPPTATTRTKLARVSALLTDGGNSFTNSINLDLENSGNLRGTIVTGGVLQVDIQTSAYAAGTRIKMAICYKANDVVLYINGTQIGSDTSATIPVCTAYEIGSYETVSTTQTNRINAAALWKTRLTNDELERLTGVGFNTYTEMANYYNYITQ